MKLLILDRDGVINEDSDNYIKSVDEWQPIEGSIDAIARLHKAGFTLVVATNQSGLARGLFDLDDLEAMHDKMNQLVLDAGGEIAGVFYCPHHPDENCSCRKPEPGLIDAIERELATSAQGAILVGDSLRDLEAGIARGCVPMLVTTGKGQKTLVKIQQQARPEFTNLSTFNNLAEVADYLINLK